MTSSQKRKSDPQITCMAGEFLVAGKLSKLGLQVSVTLGNAKSIDLLAYNPSTGKNFNIQVKTLRMRNCFPIRKEAIHANHIYVFVILNRPDESEDFFILRGQAILDDINRFYGSTYDGKKTSPMPAMNYGPLKAFRDNWEEFDK